MAVYILRRLISAIPVLLGVSFLVFAVGKITPGDPARIILGVRATPENIAEMRKQLNLDDPLVIQYGKYILNVIQGDFGRSYKGQTPVFEEIVMRIPPSFELGAAAFLFAVIVGIPAGIAAARNHNKLTDNSIMMVALTWLSLPSFWVAIVVIIVFGVQLKWIPITGGEGLSDLIAPAFCLGIGPAAVLARLTRASSLEVFREDYVRTAYAKGLSDQMVQMRHILRNALIPVVTFLGFLFADLIGGAVFIESVFARPGLGRFAINAINGRDMPQIQGIVLMGATLYVLMNLLVDILYGIIDPRIGYS